MTTVSEYLFSRVADLGVKHVFLLPGGGCMHLVDALARSERLEPVPLLHEQSVGVAAEAYGQFTNNLGVALVTTGPGGTNALTAVAAAWLDSTPCLFISGQVKTADLVGDRGVRQFGFREVDIISMVQPITKYARTLMSADGAVEQIEDALILAKSGRPGPVWLDIPLDVQAAPISGTPPQKVDGERSSVVMDLQHHAEQDVRNHAEHVVSLLTQSRRPLLLIGNGVRLSQAERELRKFVALAGIPVALTWKALDLLDEGDRLNAGRPGGVGSWFANLALQSADVIVSIGARLDLGQVGYRHDTFGRGAATKVVVDVDPSEITKLQFPGLYGVEADAGAFIRSLINAWQMRPRPSWDDWIQQIQYWRSRYPIHDPVEDHWDDGMSVYSIVEELSRQLEPQDVFAPGSSGACSEIAMQAFRAKPGQRVLNSEGLGSMGFGIPGAIGACVASGRRTVCLDGDGGFAMNLQDLASVARMQLPICFVVLDNSGYGSIQTTQDRYFGGRRLASDFASGLALPNYVQLQGVFGVPVRQADVLSTFRTELSEALSSRAPSVIIAKVSPRHETRFRVFTTFNKEGKPSTSALDDLVPARR